MPTIEDDRLDNYADDCEKLRAEIKRLRAENDRMREKLLKIRNYAAVGDDWTIYKFAMEGLGQKEAADV